VILIGNDCSFIPQWQPQWQSSTNQQMDSERLLNEEIQTKDLFYAAILVEFRDFNLSKNVSRKWPVNSS
jgi:hypothetical protein